MNPNYSRTLELISEVGLGGKGNPIKSNLTALHHMFLKNIGSFRKQQKEKAAERPIDPSPPKTHRQEPDLSPNDIAIGGVRQKKNRPPARSPRS